MYDSNKKINNFTQNFLRDYFYFIQRNINLINLFYFNNNYA
jgi:hypothetical protein